jgi:hypothetical protein
LTRTLSTLTRQALNAPETDETFIILLTLDHDDLEEPVRVTSDAVTTVSRGNTFAPFPFQLFLPDDDENRAPRARLTIDNIDRQIISTLRQLQTAPTLLMEIVLASDPDTVEAKFVDFKLTNVTYDAHVVQGDLTIEDFTAEPFPAASFSPSLFPGIF